MLYLTLKELVNITQEGASFLILNLIAVCYYKVIPVLEHRFLNGFDLYFWHLPQSVDHKASQCLSLEVNLKQTFPAVHGLFSPHCSPTCLTPRTMPTLPEEEGQPAEAQHTSSPPVQVSNLKNIFYYTVLHRSEAETCCFSYFQKFISWYLITAMNQWF